MFRGFLALNEESNNYITASPFSPRIVSVVSSTPRHFLLQRYFLLQKYLYQILTKLWSPARILLCFRPSLKQGTVTLNSPWAFRSSFSACLHLTCVVLRGTDTQARLLLKEVQEHVWKYCILQHWEQDECYRLNRFIRRSVLPHTRNKSSWCLGSLESCSNSYLSA